jgi:hypothetical protein
MRRVLLLAVLAILSSAARAQAQAGSKLAFLIPNLYGPNGLVVDSEARLPDGSTHSAHFNSAFQSEFTQFNIALAGQLAALPLPSPASGFTYEFDSSLGVFSRSTQSFGPILAERAETIGKKKFTFGLSFQYFSFDKLEGLDLSDIETVFTHDNFQAGGGRADVVTTVNNIESTVSQFTLFFTYGLADRLDLSLAVPVVRTELSVVSDATIQRMPSPAGTSGSPATHFFRDASGGFGTRRQFSESGSASGIGDLIVRLKGTAVRSGATGLGLGVDLRLPTGDEEDLLGVGSFGLKPFAAISFSRGKFSPHINFGYQYNGESVLAGDVQKGTKADFPDQFLYVFGADIGVAPKFTLAFDILGQYVIDSPRLVEDTFTPAGGSAFRQIAFNTESFSVLNGAVGFKVNVGGNLLIDFNLLFKLNDSGLRDNLTPLFGIEYSF